MLRLLVAIVVVAVLVGSTLLGPIAFVAVQAVYWPWFAYCKLVVPRTLPRKLRTRIEGEVDPTAGPPSGAVPIELPIADRIAAAEGRDWDAYRGLFSRDATFPRRHKKPHSLSRHVLFMRAMHKLLRTQQRGIRQTMADPERPDVFWVRGAEIINPRHDAAFEVEWWERWTLTPDQGRVRSRAHMAYGYAGELRVPA